MVSELAYSTVESTARAVLNEALDMMTKSGIPAAGHVAFGDVVDSIVRLANCSTRT